MQPQIHTHPTIKHGDGSVRIWGYLSSDINLILSTAQGMHGNNKKHSYWTRY